MSGIISVEIIQHGKLASELLFEGSSILKAYGFFGIPCLMYVYNCKYLFILAKQIK